ncbi:MAG: FadR/GntR family transcriptional regulator, partial [Mycobacterium leprae]
MAGFVPIKNERLYEKVAEQIKSMLQEGHLRAGDRLPAERDLAQRLGVSRAAVREALSALGMAGLVEVR